MDNPRSEKVAVVKEVQAKLANSDAAILTEYRGLTVAQLAELRTSLRAQGGEYKVYKNTLVRFAVRELNIADIEETLTGPTAIAFVKGDAAAVAKSLRDFAKANPNLVVKGGVLGDKALSAAGAAALAELPSREVLLAQIAGLLAAPLSQFAGLLQALPRNFAYGLKALAEQGGAAGASPAPSTDSSSDAAETTEAEAPAEAPAGEAADEAAETTPETESK